MLKLFLWLRYLRKKKIVFLSIAAVALSVSLLIVVSSLFAGFINAFEQAAVEAIGDVVVSPPYKFAKYPLFIEQLKQTGTVKDASPILLTPGLLHLGPGNVRPVEIWGIEPRSHANVTGLKRSLHKQKGSAAEPSFSITGSPDEVGGFVGIGLVTDPNEQTDEYDMTAVEEALGHQVFLTTGSANETQTEGESMPQFRRRTLRFSIADIVETGVHQFDKGNAYLPIEELQRRLYPEEELPVAGQILVKVADDTSPDVALAVIRGVWRNFVEKHLQADPYLMGYTRIETSKQMQSRYVAAYRNQMGVLLVIFGVVSFSVVVLIFCIFYLIVTTKRKNIAVIKSCGTASRSVASIFLGFGVCIGIAGAAVGTVLGYVITRNINAVEEGVRIIFGLKLWKSSVYMFTKIPNEVDWSWAFRIILLAIAAAAIGSLIPAIVAAITKPVEILRYE